MEKQVGKSRHTSLETAIQADGSNHPFVFTLKDYVIEGMVTKISNDGHKMDHLPSSGDIVRYDKLQSLAHHTKIIAHDLNNALSSIMANADLAGFCVEDDDEVGENISQIRDSSLDARNLVKKLQTRADGDAPHKKSVAVKDLLDGLSEYMFKDSVTNVKYQLDSGLLSINVDKDLIHEVFQNILLNAIQAMPKASKVEITAKNIKMEKQNSFNLLSGEYVRITIIDKGCGISQNNLSSVTEPFFTTKEDAKGLGLAVASQIIKNHNGSLDIESKENEGTSVHVYLPAAAKSEETKHSAGQLVEGKGRILVMDDRSEVRNIVRHILEKLGYETDCTIDGFEALEYYRKAMDSGKSYDAVILDLNIPSGMGAEKTMQELLKIDPKVKALVASGFHDATIMKDYQKFGFCGYLTKPFTVSDFSLIISDIVHGTRLGAETYSGKVLYS
jgi:signal transduction histidine kinase/ActR/RegA family two-component response regulator